MASIFRIDADSAMRYIIPFDTIFHIVNLSEMKTKTISAAQAIRVVVQKMYVPVDTRLNRKSFMIVALIG